jgi:tRNA U38,U39,U40 pseudouridine synthase TruA
MSDASKNIFCVYHIRIIAPKKKIWFTRHETDRFLNNHCQECVRAYLSIHDCLSFRHDQQSSEQNNRKLISLNNNGEDDKHAHGFCRFLIVGNIFRLETCMNSLVKVPPYSKLNFQGKNFFTQNWCNITLKLEIY